MSREAMLILVGVLVALSPFSGLPQSWLAVLLPLLGLIAAGIGYAMRHEQVKLKKLADPSAVSAHAAPADSPLAF